MISPSKNIFFNWAPKYWAAGFQPRPIAPGSKSCFVRGWQAPNSEFSSTQFDRWLGEFRNYGIGLLMGSELSDGSRLGAIDVDHDQYVGLTKALLGDPVSGRIGRKGIVYFVRVDPEVKGNPEAKVEEYGKVMECLFAKRLCVIPPTIHPVTKQPYRWVGTPLLETDPLSLPLITV